MGAEARRERNTGASRVTNTPFWIFDASLYARHQSTAPRNPALSLFSELQRRNVFRVALAYLVIGWLALQVADVLVNALELPAVWSKALIALLAIGFIPVLVFSWVYEMTPEGLKKESEVRRGESITPHTARKLNLAIIVLLVLAIGLFAADRFIDRPAPAAPPPVAEVSPASASDIPVVAVLPLKALSTDEEGTFLASGLHDDLLTRLAKLQAFKVISRTSVMEYADTVKNIRQIGRELGAGFIVEGGLQSIGGRVSINAQLIDANTDEHLWAETFNRALTTANLFEVQAEIAGAISDALHAALSPSDLELLAERPTDNLDAYRAYLRGREASEVLSLPDMIRSRESFAEAVELDPDFADAWALLGRMYVRLYWEQGGENDADPDESLVAEARAALDRAQALAPRAVDVLVSEAYYHYYAFRDYSEALTWLGKAEAVAPFNHTVVALRGYLLRRLGRLDESIEALLHALELSPNHRGHIRETMLTLRDAARCPEAMALAELGLSKYPGDDGILMSAAWSVAVCKGNHQRALDLVRNYQVTTASEWLYANDIHQALGDLEGAIKMARFAQREFADQPLVQLAAAVYLAGNYRLTGRPDLAAEAQAEATRLAAEVPAHGSLALLYHAFEAALRGDARRTVELGEQGKAAFPNDAYTRPTYNVRMLQAYTLSGDRDAAWAQFEQYLDNPMASESYVIGIDPWLAPLRADPRFAEWLDTHTDLGE